MVYEKISSDNASDLVKIPYEELPIEIRLKLEAEEASLEEQLSFFSRIKELKGL